MWGDLICALFKIGGAVADRVRDKEAREEAQRKREERERLNRIKKNIIKNMKERIKDAKKAKFYKDLDPSKYSANNKGIHDIDEV
jgi:hypothetical protein